MQAAERREHRLSPADVDRLSADWHDRLSPAIERVWEDAVSSIRADLREWLSAMVDSGWVPTHFELGFGLPPGSPSLGEILAQGKSNLQAPWLGITGFLILAVMLSLLVFIGEAVRDAFDPRKTVAARPAPVAVTPAVHPAAATTAR